MNWHTETRKISELKNWESNPRTISEESYKELKESINDLGNFEPLVINVDGTVLAGNQRLRIHKERGDIEVEVSVPERELTEQEIKKIGIISNRHSGEWDMDKLADGFGDVMEEIGFGDLMPVIEGDFNEDFSLKNGDREPFRQMTFTFSDEQATEIEEAIRTIKQTNEYKTMDMFGNENSNGNALFTIIKLWQEQKTLK